MNKVILVGAGPGDPELITLKGLRALERADVVLYDYLSHPNLLHNAPNARHICVGKRKGQHSKQQSQINRLMKKYAAQGKAVVRLKGGDPNVFGRGGEEMEFLTQHKIPFEVIPGVTSAIAVPTYAGIPITHRDLSKSVAFVTGSPKKGETLSDIHIPDADTLVFLMPVTHLAPLAKRLQKMPRFSSKTPAALIFRGASAAQKTVVKTLATIAETNIEPPAILVVGAVAALAKRLSWYEKLPLFGKRIVLLRANSQADEMAQRYGRQGAEVVKMPLLKFKAIKWKADLKKFDQIAFTGANGVNHFLNHVDSRTLAGKSILAIGAKTAEALRKWGIIADAVPQDASSEGLKPLLKNKRTLIPTSAQSPRLLRSESVTYLPVYATLREKITGPALQDGDWVIFSSSSTAEHFFENVYRGEKITAFCIGAQTAKSVRRFFKGDIREALP